jgi:hypothetical protein
MAFFDTINDAEQNFLRTIEAQRKVTREPDGATYLTKYQIPADQWRTWAAAAGLPGARWDDPRASAEVAAWAARTLYSEFKNWSLVAIGWRYGAATARQIQQLYGSTPAQEVINRVLGVAGATFVDKVIKAQTTAMAPTTTTTPPGPPRPRGQVDVRFVPEEGPSPPPQARGPNPAHTALIGVLASMANRASPSGRMSVEDALVQIVPENLDIEPRAADAALTEEA